jgi:hypothetical protein
VLIGSTVTGTLWRVTVARTRAARLRGVFVGAIAGVTAVAGHGLGGAAMPGSAAVVMVVLCSAVVGAAASVDAPRRVPLVTAYLAAGQLLGHYLLGFASDHAHATQWSAPMLAAHAVAALAAGALICTAERLFAAVAAAVWRLILVLVAVRDAGRRRSPSTGWWAASMAVRTRAGSGRVTRGPPSFAAA